MTVLGKKKYAKWRKTKDQMKNNTERTTLQENFSSTDKEE